MNDSKAEPAPTDDPGDELARLLLSLPILCAAARDGSIRAGGLRNLASACSLLLDERERVSAAMRPYHAPTRDEGSYERTLSRVLAELDRLRADDGARLSGIVAKNRELTDALGHAEEDRDALRARVAELEARAPAGHRVAALLDRLEDAAHECDTAPASDNSERTRLAGRAGGIRYAAKIVHDWGAPSALDLAAAEVCALDVETVADPRDAVGFIFSAARAATDRRGLATIVAIGLRALACDAKGGA